MSSTTIIAGNNGTSAAPSNNPANSPLTPRNGKGSNVAKIATIAGISVLSFGGIAWGGTALWDHIKNRPEDAENAEEQTTEEGTEEVEQDVVFDTDGNDEILTDEEIDESETENVTDTTVVEESYEPVGPLYNHPIEVAVNVNDDMSFAEAFAEARQEVGNDGVFIWHGQVYGTMTGDEWNSLSPAEQQAYAQQMSNPYNYDYDDVMEYAHNVGYITEDADQDITVMEMGHDEDLGNYGIITVDDELVVVADVDEDGVYDVMAYDANGDGHFDENEILLLEDQNLTVSDLEAMQEPEYDDLDYTDEIIIEDDIAAL